MQLHRLTCVDGLVLPGEAAAAVKLPAQRMFGQVRLHPPAGHPEQRRGRCSRIAKLCMQQRSFDEDHVPACTAAPCASCFHAQLYSTVVATTATHLSMQHGWVILAMTPACTTRNQQMRTSACACLASAVCPREHHHAAFEHAHAVMPSVHRIDFDAHSLALIRLPERFRDSERRVGDRNVGAWMSVSSSACSGAGLPTRAAAGTLESEAVKLGRSPSMKLFLCLCCDMGGGSSASPGSGCAPLCQRTCK